MMKYERRNFPKKVDSIFSSQEFQTYGIGKITQQSSIKQKKFCFLIHNFIQTENLKIKKN